MRLEQHDPLPFELWLSELGKLAEAAASELAEHEDRAVRRAYYLLQLAPPSLRALGDPGLAESTIELLLENGHAEQAARLIAGPGSTITLTRPRARHRHQAVISVAGALSAHGEGDSPALALVGAWTGLFRKAPEHALLRLSASR
ncbi:MAG: hypothetical protein B7Z33_10485 [Sphingomonadales bacterium 12-68-11]|nr:MAG: hypothetical protein B7Z33_10485 [Sphingomonadales bacterium 12-68-11]